MKLYCISGLPRAGSTLLCNVLAQNPEFYASQTSGLLDSLMLIRNQWDRIVEMRAMNQELSERRKVSVLTSVLNGYYADRNEPVIFDKSRGWLAHLELLKSITDYQVKVLVPVRDLRDVLASFEKLFRKNSPSRQPMVEAQNYAGFQTVEQRCDTWARYDQPVGIAYNRIKDALQRGWRDSMFFVDYDRFTQNPKRMMENIYAFLEEPLFNHDFKNVKQVTWEDDTMHGYGAGDLHAIRSEIKPQPPQYPTILGAVAEKYKGLELW